MATLMIWVFVSVVNCFLNPLTEAPNGWVTVANDHWASKAIRRDSVIHLFHYHIRPGMKLSEVAKVLNCPTWLRPEEIYTWNNVAGGFIPVDIKAGDTTFNLRIFPELENEMGAVYIRVSGELNRQSILQALWGCGDDKANNAVIREIAADPLR